MKKKILSMLIVPFAAILMLFGCGPTQRTVKEITEMFTTNIAAYDYAVVGENTQAAKNWYFVKPDSAANAQNIAVRVTFSNECGLDDVIHQKDGAPQVDGDLAEKYEQYRSVYERELTMIWSYYQTFAKTFYDNAETQQVSSEELTTLYGKADDLLEELEKFNSSKIDFEREVKLYGINSKILLASIDRFNYAYNGLVKASIDFVKYFRDLHYNYFFKESHIYDVAYATQLYYDANLMLAEYIYHDYLVPLTLNKNSVTLDDLLKAGISSEYNIFKSSNLLVTNIAVVDTTTKNIRLAKVSGHLENAFNVNPDTGALVNEGAATKAINEIKKFETSLNNFKQYYKLYEKSFAKIDVTAYYNHRYYRNGITTTYEQKLQKEIDENNSKQALVEKTNINVVHDFEKVKVSTMIRDVTEFVMFTY